MDDNKPPKVLTDFATALAAVVTDGLSGHSETAKLNIVNQMNSGGAQLVVSCAIPSGEIVCRLVSQSDPEKSVEVFRSAFMGESLAIH